MKTLALIGLIPLLAAGQVKFRETPGKIEISIDGKPFSNLYYGPNWAKPFLHPLRSVSGVVVTRGYPVEQIEGENRDHNWHHGLWYAHGDVNGVDFWRDLGPEKTGRMVVKGKPKIAGNSLAVETDMVAPDKKVLGAVSEIFRFARSGSNHVVDVHVSVRADRGIPLKMGDTEEGTFGLRLADEFRQERGVAMNNSAGQSGRKIWGKRAKWVDYSTTIKGEKLGVIVLDHPSNPKHPTYWHARHYSLCSANPFGERDFEKDKTRDGSVPVPAGGSLDFRYRVLIHPGGLDGIDPEKLFQDFAGRK
jgi:hypothetical protein